MSKRVIVGLIMVLAGCAPDRARPLGELEVVDSTYVDPETGVPYTGTVVAHFSDSLGGGVQLEARLEEGTWEGELTIFHTTGRIRYQGRMAGGTQCGGWVENEDPRVPQTLLDEVKEELESLVIYPECAEG